MNFEFGNMVNGMFKPIARGACKMGMNGKVAVRTSTGYKTYDIKKNKLTNCDSFAFDMDGMFWVVPTFKVECGDIILVNGKPRCVIEVGNTIKVLMKLSPSIMSLWVRPIAMARFSAHL